MILLPKVLLLVVLALLLLDVSAFRFKRSLPRYKRYGYGSDDDDTPGCGPYNPRACGAETAMAYGYTSFGQGGGGYGGGSYGYGGGGGYGGGYGYGR
ncbi:hypothetical protein AAVH_13187 [Aphelenchoides avenae]|nr:hypothetical protein AAVH_13187 [Aphelenchus avenae]